MPNNADETPRRTQQGVPHDTPQDALHSTPQDAPHHTSLNNLIATMRRLVWPGGCAWHVVQTHESLTPFLIEETAEFIDAIEREFSAAEVVGELGDVLYQVLFHAAIAERDGEGYDLDAVAATLDAKLIARHPHVFGDRGYMSVEELNAEWERLKEDAAGEQRGSRGALDGIPAGMPTLARAAKVIERLKRAGLLEVQASLRPEPSSDATASELVDPAVESRAASPAAFRDESHAALPATPLTASHAQAHVEIISGDDAAPEALDEDQLGDAMLALLMQANAAGIDADRALRLATGRLAATLS